MIIKELISEFFGTMVLVVLGNGVTANVILPKTKGYQSGWMAVTTSRALAVVLAMAVSGRSLQAHLNPALTLIHITQGSIDFLTGSAYIISQFFGGMIGGILIWFLYKDHFEQTSDSEIIRMGFCTVPSIRNIPHNFFAEMFATFIFVLSVLGINHPSSGFGEFTGFLAACALWSVGLSLGGTTGYAINPARDFGPRLAHWLLPIRNKGNSDWPYSWVPVLGPIIGAFLAHIIHRIIV